MIWRDCFALSAAILLIGCQSAGEHTKEVRAAQDGNRIDVGTVQREVRIGMSGADVIQALGSPNIVSTDSQRREVWVYDRISTETVYSRSSGGISALIFGGFLDGGLVGGGAGGGYSSSAGARSSSQRTFTVVIKFDENKLVRDFAYQTTRF